MSGVEDLITQVSSSEDDVHLTAKNEEKKAAPKKSCFWRYFCCCSTCCMPKQQAQPASTPMTNKQPTVDRKGPSTPSNNPAPTPQPSQSAQQSGGQLPPPPHPLTKYLLPPLQPHEKGKKCLVLDLDETLVHSSFKPIPNPDFVISIELENVIHKVYVRKRPGVDNFMRVVGEKFEVVIFTASLAKYADPLLDILDRSKIVKVRLFREACVQHYGNYVKDLTHLGRPLEHTLIIDNSPFSYMFQPDNAIPISSWFNDRNDRQLYDLLPFLDQIAACDDVVSVLQKHKLSFNSNPP